MFGSCEIILPCRILFWRCAVYFTRYLEEFEKKIPRAEMLELQVFRLFLSFILISVIIDLL